MKQIKNEVIATNLKSSMTLVPDGFVVQEAFLFERLPKDIQEKIYYRDIGSETFFDKDFFESLGSFLDRFSVKLGLWSMDDATFGFDLLGIEGGYVEELQSEIKDGYDLVKTIVSIFPERYILKTDKINSVMINGPYCSLSGISWDEDILEHSLDLVMRDAAELKKTDFEGKYKHMTLEKLIVVSTKCLFNTMHKEREYFFSFERFSEDEVHLQHCYTMTGQFLGSKEDLIPFSFKETEEKINLM